MPPRAHSPSSSAHSSHWRLFGNTQTVISPSAPRSVLRLPPSVSQFCAADCEVTLARSGGAFVVHAASASTAINAVRRELLISAPFLSFSRALDVQPPGSDDVEVLDALGNVLALRFLA